MANHGFPTNPEGSSVSHDALRLQLARLILRGTQEDQKQTQTPKLPPNPKIRMMTILHQFRGKAARTRNRLPGVDFGVSYVLRAAGGCKVAFGSRVEKRGLLGVKWHSHSFCACLHRKKNPSEEGRDFLGTIPLILGQCGHQISKGRQFLIRFS